MQQVQPLSAGPTCATGPTFVSGSNFCNGSNISQRDLPLSTDPTFVNGFKYLNISKYYNSSKYSKRIPNNPNIPKYVSSKSMLLLSHLCLYCNIYLGISDKFVTDYAHIRYEFIWKWLVLLTMLELIKVIIMIILTRETYLWKHRKHTLPIRTFLLSVKSNCYFL